MFGLSPPLQHSNLPDMDSYHQPYQTNSAYGGIGFGLGGGGMQARQNPVTPYGMGGEMSPANAYGMASQAPTPSPPGMVNHSFGGIQARPYGPGGGIHGRVGQGMPQSSPFGVGGGGAWAGMNQSPSSMFVLILTISPFSYF
jgi:hypothetical protein